MHLLKRKEEEDRADIMKALLWLWIDSAKSVSCVFKKKKKKTVFWGMTHARGDSVVGRIYCGINDLQSGVLEPSSDVAHDIQ